MIDDGPLNYGSVNAQLEVVILPKHEAVCVREGAFGSLSHTDEVNKPGNTSQLEWPMGIKLSTALI